MSGSTKRKRPAEDVTEAGEENPPDFSKKRGKRKFVTPELIDVTSKQTFFFPIINCRNYVK